MIVDRIIEVEVTSPAVVGSSNEKYASPRYGHVICFRDAFHMESFYAGLPALVEDEDFLT